MSKIPALIIINGKLLETGMSQIEIDQLLARFLQEEAFDFVVAVNKTIEEKENTVVS